MTKKKQKLFELHPSSVQIYKHILYHLDLCLNPNLNKNGFYLILIRWCFYHQSYQNVCLI